MVASLRRQTKITPEAPTVPHGRSAALVSPKVEDEAGGMKSLVAAAAQVPLEPIKTINLRIRDEEWQQESWRHYDINGELRFVANRHASALSRCRIFVASVDKTTGKPGKEATDPQVQILSETIFGGATAKAEGLRIIGIQLYVAGEGYIVAEGANNADSDTWYVVSNKEIRKAGGGIEVKRPMTIGGGWKLLVKGQDLLMRCWTPHPRLYDVADAPTRAVLPVLREIERLTMLTFSQIDSRLISAGLLLISDGLDFPHKDDQTPAQALADTIVEVARRQLTGAGTAAGLVPIIATVAEPTTAGSRTTVSQSFAHVKFDSPLQDALEKKLDQAIRRLAMGLEVAPEDLLGQGDANHWSGWQIEESSINLFIAPALARICDSLTQAYLKPALKTLGIDPDDYTLWYDTSELVVRPNRQQDALALWEQGVLSDDSLRKAGAWDDSDKPTNKQMQRWIALQLVKLNPALIGDPIIAGLLGMPQGIQVPAPPAPPGGEGDGTDPMLAEGQQLAGLDSGADQRALPQMPDSQQSPAQAGGQYAVALLPGAEQTVLRALELAGGRLLDRQNRGRLGAFSRHEIHTQVKPRDIEHAKELMSGAWSHVPALAAHYGIRADRLEDLLSGYCAELLTRGYPHSSDLLSEVLTKATARLR